MAYTQQDYGMGAEYGYETEEERRRREEEEARQREIEMMANTGMGLPESTPAVAGPNRGLADLASAYMNKRVDQAQQRVSDVGQMFEDPQAALEKRLGMTSSAVDTEPTPVKQTITTDPTTGEQKMKIEGSVQDLTAANPLTPTVSGPAVPTQMPPPAAPQAQAQPRLMPMTVPAQLPAAGPIDPNAQRPDIGQPPTPGPGVQVAGAPGAPMPAVPVAPVTMAAAPAGGQTPAAVAAAPGASVAQIAQAPAAAPAAPAEPAWVAAANSAGTDFGKLVDVAAKFPESRAAIQIKLQGVVEENRKAQEAQRIVADAQAGDPKAMNKLEQALRPTRGKEREEVTTTDYLKAYMYARLGLNDLSAEVQAKIAGKDTKFGQVTFDGSKWSVETNAKTGEIIRAKDDEGNVATPNTINKLKAAGLAVTTATPPSATAVRIRDSENKEWSQVPTPQGMRFYDNEGKLGVPKGRTIPIAVGSDLEIAQARQDIETVAKFGTMTAQARLDAWANTNKLRADKGLNGKTLEEMGLNPDGSLMGEAVRRVGTPAMGAGQPATAQTAPIAPVVGAPAPAPAPAPALLTGPGSEPGPLK